jgi:hypothetical protein
VVFDEQITSSHNLLLDVIFNGNQEEDEIEFAERCLEMSVTVESEGVRKKKTAHLQHKGSQSKVNSKYILFVLPRY